MKQCSDNEQDVLLNKSNSIYYSLQQYKHCFHRLLRMLLQIINMSKTRLFRSYFQYMEIVENIPNQDWKLLKLCHFIFNYLTASIFCVVQIYFFSYTLEKYNLLIHSYTFIISTLVRNADGLFNIILQVGNLDL